MPVINSIVPLTTIPPNIASLAGPQLIGIFISWALLGVLATQVYIYTLWSPKDPLHIKLLVYGLFTIEIIQTCMLSSDCFHWLIDGWGRLDVLENYYMSWFDVPIMVGFISCTVQVFFAWRIYILSSSYILSGTIICLSAIQALAGITSGIQLRKLPSFAEIGQLAVPVYIWHIGSAFVDVLIAITMTYLLTRVKNKNSEISAFVSRLVRLTVETGIVTATVSTVDLVLFNVFKHNNLHICPAIILGKLYTNTMMVIINNRIFAARGSTRLNSNSMGVFTTIELSPSEFQGVWRRDPLARNNGQNTDLEDSFPSSNQGGDLSIIQDGVPLATGSTDKTAFAKLKVEQEARA